MLDVLLVEENLIILGIAFGLLMCSGLIIDIIVQACKKDDDNDQH